MANINIMEYANPALADALPLWKQMADTYAGEYKIKAAGITYLPMTDGQAADYASNNNKLQKAAQKRYNSYKLRANFPNYTKDTIISMLGVMYAEKPRKIDLPSKLEPMKEFATPYGDTLEMLMRRINENQLIYGRRGLLLEPAPTPTAPPKILEYAAETIINWGTYRNAEGETKLKFVLLNESGKEAQGLKYAEIEKYRLIALDGGGVYYSLELSGDDDFSKIDIDNPPGGRAVYPELLGKTASELPFVFINACSVLPDIEQPPLLALSNICISIYRSDADYRQHLYQQAQDTAFFKGFSDDEIKQTRLGAGCAVGTTNADADFKFVGVNSAGLPEERTALDNLHVSAMNMGIALVEQKQVESGEALKTRLAVKTASMKTIALSCARGIETLLQSGAEWMGVNPDAVVIEPNLDYSGANAAAKDLLDLWNAKLQGAPISAKSYHEFMRKNDYTELDYEEEMQEIEEEGGVLNFNPAPPASSSNPPAE